MGKYITDITNYQILPMHAKSTAGSNAHKNTTYLTRQAGPKSTVHQQRAGSIKGSNVPHLLKQHRYPRQKAHTQNKKPGENSIDTTGILCWAISKDIVRPGEGNEI